MTEHFEKSNSHDIPPSHENKNGERAQENAELTAEQALERLESVAEGFESAQRDIDERTDEILSAPEATGDEKREAEQIQRKMQTLANSFLYSARPGKEDPEVIEALGIIAEIPSWQRYKPVKRSLNIFIGFLLGVSSYTLTRGPEETEAAAPTIAHVEPAPTDTLEQTPETEISLQPLTIQERQELEQYQTPTLDLVRFQNPTDADRIGMLIGRWAVEDAEGAQAIVYRLLAYGKQANDNRAFQELEIANGLTHMLYALPPDIGAHAVDELIADHSTHVNAGDAPSIAEIQAFEDSFLGKVTDPLFNRDEFVGWFDLMEPASLRQLLEEPYPRMHFGGSLMISLAERDIEQLQECMNALPYRELSGPIRRVLRSDDGAHFLDTLSDVLRDGSVHADSLVAAMGDEVLTQNLETFGNFERAFEVVGIEPFLERLPKMDARDQYNFGFAVSAMDATHHEAIVGAIERMHTVQPDDFMVYAHLEQGLRYGGVHAAADRIRTRLAEMRERSPELKARFVQEENTFLDRENDCDRQLIELIGKQHFIERDVESKRGKPGIQSLSLRDTPLHYNQFNPGEQVFADLQQTFREVTGDSERPYEQLVSSFQERFGLPSDKSSALLTILTLLRESGDPGNMNDLYAERARFERQDDQEALAELQPRFNRSTRLNTIYTLVLDRLKNNEMIEMYLERSNHDLFQILRVNDTSEKMQLLAEQLDERELDEELREATVNREVLQWAMREPLMVRFGHEFSPEEHTSNGEARYVIEHQLTYVPENVILGSFTALRDLQSRNVPIVGKLMFGAYPTTSKSAYTGLYLPIHDEACILPHTKDSYSTTVHENGHFDADIGEEMPGVFTSEMMPLQSEGRNLTELSEGNLYASVSDYAGLTGEAREELFPNTNPQWEDYAETYELYFARGNAFRAKIMIQQMDAQRYRREGNVPEAEKLEEGTRLLEQKYNVMKRRFGGQEFNERGSLYPAQESRSTH